MRHLAALLVGGMLLAAGIAGSAAEVGDSDQSVSALGSVPSPILGGTSPVHSPLAPEAGTQPQLTPVNPLNFLPSLQQSSDSIDKVLKLEADGEKYFQQHLLDKALQKWQDAYGMSIEMKYAEGEGTALTNMCRIYLERGQWVKAKYLGENAVEVLAGVSDKRALGKARVALAQAYFGLDNIYWAGQQLDEALRIFTTDTSTNNAPEAAQVLNLAGALLVKYGKVKEALQFFEAAATYYAQAGEQMVAIGNYSKIAGAMQEFGLLTAAREEAEKAMSVARNNPDKPELMVAALGIKANALYNLCEFAQAKATYEKLIGLATKINPKLLDLKGRATIDLGYGHCLSGAGEGEAARQVFERAVPALKKSGNMPGEADALNALGVIETNQGDFQKAVQHFSQALDLHAVLRPKRERSHFLLYQNLAIVQARAGNNREAKVVLEQSLPLAKKFKDHVLGGRSLCSLAEITYKLADVQQSESYARKAIAATEVSKDDACAWRAYTILAKLQLAQDDTSAAKESLTSALSFFRSPQSADFASPDRLNFPTTRRDLGEQLVSLVSKQGMAEQALLAAEQLKEEEFVRNWQDWGAQVKSDEKDVYTDLVMQRAHLHAAESVVDPQKLQTDWQRWMTRFRALIAQNPNLARMIAPVPNQVMDLVHAVQARHETVVEYLVGHSSAVAFTVDPSGRISASVLPVARKTLQSQVTAVRVPPSGTATAEQIAMREKSTLQSLCHELLPTAVTNFIPKTADQSVVIIPDQVLFNLPFQALIDTDGKFMIEKHTITVAPSMALILHSPPRYSEDGSVVLVTSGRQGAGRDEQAVEQAVPPEQLSKMSGPEADLTAIQDRIRGKSVVQLVDPAPVAVPNPLRTRMPFKLAKAGDIVTAESLFSISLPADLFFFSASSVPAHDLEGTAVEGISRGFAYAGCRNLILSLWVEPGQSRDEQLADFYKFKQSGMNQAQALRKSQLQAIGRNQSPRSWAALQLIGPGN